MKDLHCVHLDFHTSEKIHGIGSEYSEENFIGALKAARLDSITLFAKCHHGCFYYPSEQFFTHPHLEKPLLDLQVEACKKAGVSAKIYISAGFDEYSANEHPEWLRVRPDGSAQNMLEAKFHFLCFNSPYLDRLVAQTEEVVRRYMPDGIFLDIVSETPCTCRFCRESIEAEGKDWRDPAVLAERARKTYRQMADAVTAAAKRIKPDVMTFFNAGKVPVGNFDYIEVNDQLELEALPTGGWGYDYFPMTMSYARRLGKNCTGMTGKFHRSWGEFGGFKYRDALVYEGAQCVVFDAGLCVGDQLHPSGKMDTYTYENVGNAVKFMEKYEPYRGGEYLPELAVLTCDSSRSGSASYITGITRMLFEAKYLFDLISPEEISPLYPVIVLADSKRTLNKETLERLRDYVAQGGKILACADAPVYQGEIAFDLGARLVGEDQTVPAYLCADYPLETADDMALLIHEGSQTVIEATGECLAHKYSPYFVRNGVNFCSHAHTPYDPEKRSPAITCGEDGIYICADLFYEYARYGSLNPKQLLLPLLDRLLGGQKCVKTNLPSSGKVALYRKGDSLFLHLLYGNTAVRGSGVEVIEDLATLADIRVSLDLPVKKILRRPSGEEVSFAVNEEGRTEFCLDRLYCYEVLEIK